MSARRSSSTVSKRRTHSRFSFRVRMNRSAQPLPSGSRTNAGELTREPQDAAPAGADAREAQPCPQLTIALTVEGAVLQQLPDLPDQGRVRHRAERPRPPPLAAIRAAVAVDGRPRDAPQARDPLDAVRLVRGGRDPAAHRLDLLRAKGRPASSRPALAPSRSLAMVSSPTFAFRRP